MTRVIIWATHLQTDILALALHLDRCEDVALLVVTPHAATFATEPVALARPLTAEVLDRGDSATYARARAFDADVIVADNHLPPAGLAPRLFYMWHGLGWKARGKLDLRHFYRSVRRLTGIDPRRPNPAFMAQCYGPSDLAWRIDNWRLDPGSCVQIGMSFSDLLLDPPYDVADIASRYRIDVLNRRTVLLAITWHYGGIFSHAGSAGRLLRGIAGQGRVEQADRQFLDRIIGIVDANDANLLICLHDRKRYERIFVEALEELAARHPFIELRFKDEHPDNLSDLLVADVMISNLSSFLAYFYVLGRPAVHVLPAAPGMKRIERRLMLLSRFALRLWSRREEAWMLSPTDVGGPIAQTSEEAGDALRKALADPTIGAEPTRRWLARHVFQIDGGTAERFKREIERFCATPLR